MISNKLEIYNNKQKIAQIINDVLIEKITVRQALDSFPNQNIDLDIKCAFDALMYREADEDIRNKNKDYALVQDEMLLKIADSFKNDVALPRNIVSKYLEYNKDSVISLKYINFKSAIQYLKKMINF